MNGVRTYYGRAVFGKRNLIHHYEREANKQTTVFPSRCGPPSPKGKAGTPAVCVQRLSTVRSRNSSKNDLSFSTSAKRYHAYIKSFAPHASHCSSKNGFAVFDVGETILRIHQKLCADLSLEPKVTK